MIKDVVKGDLVKKAKDGEFTHVVHGVNCQGKMGKGIAKQIKEAFHGSYETYVEHVAEFDEHPEDLLGSYISGVEKRKDGIPLTVINAFIQFTYGDAHITGVKYVSYDAIHTVFKYLNDLQLKNPEFKYHVGIPKIGSDLAGGDWNVVKTIINSVTPNLNITLVEYEK